MALETQRKCKSAWQLATLQQLLYHEEACKNVTDFVAAGFDSKAGLARKFASGS